MTRSEWIQAMATIAGPALSTCNYGLNWAQMISESEAALDLIIRRADEIYGPEKDAENE